MCGWDDGFSWGNMVQKIIDSDGEHAKKCLDCDKIFYKGDECPFCSKVMVKKGVAGEQNLIKAVCPICGNAKTISGHWVKVKNKEALPEGLVEELCPECRVDSVVSSGATDESIPNSY